MCVRASMRACMSVCLCECLCVLTVYCVFPVVCAAEVPMVLYLFALVSLVLLWAGLHMGYRYLWMLILYVIFNLLLVRYHHRVSY